MSPTAIVAYLALFATVGFLFLFVSLLLGRFLRACAPTVQKLETYECGEPPVGPGSVQFDLRFYVVALVFLIFEVEVALFFPAATVFGTVTQQRIAPSTQEGVGNQSLSASAGSIALSPSSASRLALVSMVDLGAFFAILLVGFAFIWRRGDLNWVRSVRHPTTPTETAALVLKLRGDLQS